MSVADMRRLVANAYTGEKWKSKVRRMPDDQIVAIFHSMVLKGQIKFGA